MAGGLGYKIKEGLSEQSWEKYEMAVVKAYNGFRDLVRTAYDKGVALALKQLEIVIEFCREHPEVLKCLSMMAIKATRGTVVTAFVKAGVRQGAKQVAKQGAKQVAKQGAKEAAKQGAKTVATGLVKAVNPVGIGADLAQLGLEYVGMEEIGKKVGMAGNIAAGAMLGSVGGPPGAVVGALGGFLMWGAGEVVGKTIDYAFS